MILQVKKVVYKTVSVETKIPSTKHQKYHFSLVITWLLVTLWEQFQWSGWDRNQMVKSEKWTGDQEIGAVSRHSSLKNFLQFYTKYYRSGRSRNACNKDSNKLTSVISKGGVFYLLINGPCTDTARKGRAKWNQTKSSMFWTMKNKTLFWVMDIKKCKMQFAVPQAHYNV